MKLHTLRYSNPLSAILEDFFSIRFKPHQVVLVLSIDNKNFPHFTNRFFVPELASSLFDNAVKTLCAQALARTLHCSSNTNAKHCRVCLFAYQSLVAHFFLLFLLLVYIGLLLITFWGCINSPRTINIY